MENFGLYSLLELIPEDSPNYKPEYRLKAEAMRQKETEGTAHE